MPASRSAAAPTAPTPSLTRTAGRYALAAASIVAAASSSAADETYDVVSGDTVSGIAVQTGASPASIRSANNLDAQYRIRAGQRLVIPTAATSAPAQPAAPPPAATTSSHRVVAGDTVSGLALRYGCTAQSIVSANNLGPSALIRIGQTLTIGSSAPVATSATTTAAPTVQLVGDTFAGRTYSRDVVSAANQNKSGFNHQSVSPANAIGTMQVIPSSGDWASDLVGRELNLLDPQDNVTAGVAIIGRLVATSPTVDSAIAGYYQGQSSVRKYGMFDDTRRYVANVRTLQAQQ